MAVRTGEIFNSLIFGGVNSADYGIYITGEATFDAPKRLVDMVSVPGRNGAIALDQGHWDNITVEYPAGVFGSDQTDFRSAMSDFRNAIVSQIGYQRLTDTYHPDEYRMALYVEGIEVDPTAHNIAGEFTLKFNCKPQRWLTSGETAVSVSSGDTLTNPTQYASGPLLAVRGEGTINIGTQEINLYPLALGEVQLFNKLQRSGTGQIISTQPPNDMFSDSLLNVGDAITINQSSLTIITNLADIIAAELTSSSGIDGVTVQSLSNGFVVNIPTMTLGYRAGTSGDLPQSLEATLGIRLYRKGGQLSFADVVVEVANRQQRYQDTLYGQVYMFGTVTFRNSGSVAAWTTEISEVSAYATTSGLGDPTYIDCEIGEAYKVTDDSVYPLNNAVGFGSDLPTLAPGENDITFDNTITSLEITPRWWKL